MTRRWQRRFGLTAAEHSVLALLVLGSACPTIAKARGTSFNTVRNQLQSIYRKCKDDSRESVVARVLREVIEEQLSRSR